MSVAVPSMPLVPGDVLYEFPTPAVAPPANALQELSPLADPRAASTSPRAPSAGAVFAEAMGIDLETIGMAEARKIMSVEHKVLGFRPPPGSLAAEAQAAAAKHPEVSGAQPPDAEKLKEAAKEDAQRILAERNRESASPTSSSAGWNDATYGNGALPPVDLSTLSEADARKLMSHEHRALGFRPPPGSLAAEAQAAVAKTSETTVPGGTKDRRNSANTNGRVGQKVRQVSFGAKQHGTDNARRSSTDSSVRQRRSSSGAYSSSSQNGSRRADNSNIKPSPSGVISCNSQRRRSLNVSTISEAEKEQLLKEVAFKDAEKIKAVRGINGTTASEAAYIDTKALPGWLKSANGDAQDGAASDPLPVLPPTPMTNLPGPVQEAQEVQEAIIHSVQSGVDDQTRHVESDPGGERVGERDVEKTGMSTKREATSGPATLQRAETQGSNIDHVLAEQE